jgi:formamidopyrimidine-DNA glycosylase
MPELPEIEYARRLAEKICVGRTITRVNCADDPIVIVDVTPAQMRRALTRRRIVGAHRRGKYMWLRLDGAPAVLLHFGMTGSLRVPKTPGLRLAGALWPPSDEWPPRFTKLELHFDDGGRIAWTNARRLGRVRLVEDPEREPPVADLGFDPLLDPPSLAEFRRLLARRRAPIKAVLLDPSFSAGVGNWVADEVLYQARIDPRRLASELAPDDGKRLLAALRRVVQKAVEVDADSDRFPRGWLFHRRWGKNPNARDAAGHPIAFTEVGGRTTAWVPALQR